MTFFEQVGGRDMLMAVSKIFYDKLYVHPWLKEYFKNTKQSTIESQQVDFMSGALGGPKVYCGRNPTDAHVHINITEELYQLRRNILIESFEEAKAPLELRERWLKIDDAFKAAILKKNIGECVRRWVTDEILDFPNPEATTNFTVKKVS